MENIKTGDDIYNVEKYTDTELYDILDLNNPSDRELEARIFHLIQKYKTMDNESGYKLAQFFEDIYEHFFEIVEEMTTYDTSISQRLLKPIADLLPSQMEPKSASATKAVAQMDYSKDYINPILKQTIIRMISIDSGSRGNKNTTSATNFSFNLSETLRDVLSLRLSSVSITKSWYTINNNYGANFFYIKGNSPGINDGQHDYKIAISPGYYNKLLLIEEINKSITTIKNTNTDVSFGTTNISYNDNTMKSTIQLYINSIYNETDYYVHFNYFTYPKDADGIYKSIPAILGFEYQDIDIGTVVSNDLSGEGHPSNNLNYIGYTDNNESFLLTSSNNYFTVINYNGYSNNNWNKYGDIGFNDFSYNTFKIVSSLLLNVSHTREQIVSDFDARMQECIYLSPGQCGIQREYIDNANNDSYTKSRFIFKLYLNKKNTINEVNQKTVMIVPDETKIWIGPTSCFYLDASVNETSTLKSTSKYKTSDYIVGNNVYFIAECNADGYFNETNNVLDFSKNDVIVPITPGSYVLADYLTELNNAIRRADISNNHIFDPQYNDNLQNTNITGFYINSNSDYRMRMRFYINKTFSVDSYVIDISQNDFFCKFMSFDAISNYDISKNTSGACVLNGKRDIILGNNYLINNGDTLFRIKPNKFRVDVSFGNYYADPYIVKYTGPSVNGINAEEIKQILNTTIQTFFDPILKVYPFKNATVRYTTQPDNIYTYITWDITLAGMSVRLTADNYIIRFVDNNVDNTWKNGLYLSNDPYVLKDYPKDSSPQFDVSFVDILGTTKIFKNLLEIKAGVNDTITLKAASSGVVDTSGKNANDWTITVPPAIYSINKLITTLNGLLMASPKWTGSQIYTKNNYVYFKINSGKVFKTNDYRLVFYDPYSFVKCVSGSNSLRNTTWDATIGWMLGFSALTEYILSSEYQITDPNTTDTYYSDTKSFYKYNTSTDIVSISGDSGVSVDFYKYLMISLDDYTQNHLNNGLVTISTGENAISPSSYVNKSLLQCYPISTKYDKIFTGSSDNNNKSTEKQIYSANQILSSTIPTVKKYSSAPSTKDIFAIIPINSSIANGTVFSETSSTLAKNNRLYFGPVNISRMTIKLLTDRGEVVDLQGKDWGCTIECEQLYQQKSI